MITPMKKQYEAMKIIVGLLAVAVAQALPTLGTVTSHGSFTVPRSPSGLFFDSDGSGLLYVLCGTRTNGDHYLYAYTTEGAQRCSITIPQSAGMSRVDGFFISDKAYIVDSQGPIYANDDGRLGGSVYQVTWTNPCGCSSDGTCTSSTVSWTPTVEQQWTLRASDVSASEGNNGNDPHFRNSGIVVLEDSWFGVNGVHPIGGSLTGSYEKSIVQVDMIVTDATQVMDTWAFDGASLGHDVDMEGLTCGPDACKEYLYIGDEYNYIYQLDLATGSVDNEWDLNAIVGNNVPADKGIESLAYANTTGFFYAGIQQTAEIHMVRLVDVAEGNDDGNVAAEEEDGTGVDEAASDGDEDGATTTEDGVTDSSGSSGGWSRTVCPSSLYLVAMIVVITMN